MNAHPPIDTERLVSLVHELVSIYSPSGKESEVTEFLSSYLHERDLPVTLREVSEGRRNIEVVFSENPIDVAFVGHLDTVPAFDIETIECMEEDGVLYGLGTADMKAGCAAMIEAFVAHVESGHQPERAGLFLVVGEEEAGDGTAALLAARSFPWAIVGEPTELRPCLAHYGYVEMLIRAFTTRRHASMADRRHNAIPSMLRTLLQLDEWLGAEHPETIFNIRDIHSAASGFAVPGHCEASVDIHLPPETDPQVFSDRLEKRVQNSPAVQQMTECHIEFPIRAEGYRIADDARFPQLLKTVFQSRALPWQPDAFRSHSDANLLHQAGCRPVILGPGQLANAHTRDENITRSDVVLAATLYRDILSRISQQG